MNGISKTGEDKEDFDDLAPQDQQEEEEDFPRAKIGDPAESVLFNTDWTVSTIVQQIERKNIDLNPKFQRRDAWDPERRSKLIESLVIGLPIPNIVLAESPGKRGKYIVIDGKQRLSTVFDFLSKESENKLSLRGLNIRDDLNGMSFENIKSHKPDDANFLENAPIRTVVIRNWPSEEFLYVIFDRLNSGSLPLSPQELRRALQPGALLDYIDDFILQNQMIKQVLSLTKLDRRMRDSEIILRYIAFERQYPNYDGDFKAFLDEPVRYFNSKWEARKPELDIILTRLTVALDVSSKIFSAREIFRKWNGIRFENRINRALFDAVIRYFGDRQIEVEATAKRAEIVELIKTLCFENSDFKRSIELTTKTPSAVKSRLKIWGENLAPIVNRKFDETTFRLI